MKVVFYKGPPAGWIRKVSHFLTCRVTKSIYSHCELVIGGRCYTSSAMDGGIRDKEIDLASGRWDFFEVEGDENAARAWFESRKGQKYDYAGVARFVFPFIPQRRDQWFCSESVAAALGYGESWRYSPAVLHSKIIGRLT